MEFRSASTLSGSMDSRPLKSSSTCINLIWIVNVTGKVAVPWAAGDDDGSVVGDADDGFESVGECVFTDPSLGDVEGVAFSEPVDSTDCGFVFITHFPVSRVGDIAQSVSHPLCDSW